MPDDRRAFIHQFVREAPGTLYHFTPRGLRFVLLLGALCADVDVWRRAARAAAGSVATWASDVCVAEGKAWRLHIDKVSWDQGHMFSGPRRVAVEVVSDQAVPVDELAVFPPYVPQDASRATVPAWGGRGAVRTEREEGNEREEGGRRDPRRAGGWEARSAGVDRRGRA
ncbi:MAG: hypothetical protein RIT81_09860 [Deltaproteobacteria bacterium]